jgi:hypothetical protein
MFRCRLLMAFLGLAAISVSERAALADEDEASFHSQLQLGQATLGDRGMSDATDAMSMLGVGARATYATNNWYAYEAQLTWGQPGRSLYFEREDGLAVARQMSWLRLDARITARLGVELVPIVHAAIGPQTRFGGRARESFQSWTYETDGYVTFDVVGTLGLGFDWRPPGEGDHWVFGVLGTMERALWSTGPAFETRSLAVHVGYYFFWFPGSE